MQSYIGTKFAKHQIHVLNVALFLLETAAISCVTAFWPLTFCASIQLDCIRNVHSHSSALGEIEFRAINMGG
jgi:hypothetical protein